jgi:hypothetical protein
VHETPHVCPLHWSVPAHDPAPTHRTSVAAAALTTRPLQVCAAAQRTEQAWPEHEMSFVQAPDATQSTSQRLVALQVIVPWQPLSDEHCTVQLSPPQVMSPHVALRPPQSTSQLLAAEQSTVAHDVGSWQLTVQGIPAGHCTWAPQGAPGAQ